MTADREVHSSSGYPVAETYNADSLNRDGVDLSAVAPDPGEFPYTRGYEPGGYRDQLWAMEMYAGFGDPEQANRRYRMLLDNGATGGVSIALDLPTQLGYDSDDPLADGEVGRSGVALDVLDDVEQLFAGVDLQQAGHVFTTANCIAPIAYAWVWLYCQRHGIDTASFSLQIQNDPIKEYVARGTHFLPIESAVRLATDVVLFSHHNTPNWLPISVSGSHMKQAGATPALEAAFTIANALAYLTEAERRGLCVADFNPTLELHFCTEMDFFEEVAKYRAVRRAWAELARSHFGVPDSKMKFRLHAATSGRPLTMQQPLNNIARITLQVLAQVLGGVDAGRTASWDEALAIPTEDAAVTSLRINQIIGLESGVALTADPLGGSYYVEWLTDRTYRAIAAELDKIEAMGGALAAVHNGYVASRLTDGAYREQMAVESGEQIVVGVNRFQNEESLQYPRFRSDETAQVRKIDALQRARSTRDATALAKSLSSLEQACRSESNSMPAVIAAVAAGATVGEVAGVWRRAFGEVTSVRAHL